MKIISEIIKTVDVLFKEELSSDKDTVFLELEYSSVEKLFHNNNFRKFFKKAEETLSKRYGKRVVLKIESLPDAIPFGDIHAEHVGMTLQTTAMIKTITQFKLKLTSILWYCKGCGYTFRRPNTGETIEYPKVCPECGNRQFQILYEDSTYEDYKLLKLEEPIESRTSKKFVEFKGIIEGYLASPDYDLQAGDVCNIIFTLVPKLNRKTQTLDTLLDIWNIKPINDKGLDEELSPDDLNEILENSCNFNVLDRFVESFPLNIVGYENIKKGLILQLFSGGIGDDRMNIHCLLIGDPGLGKSLLLRAVSLLSPKVINVNGAGTTMAGLTASAVKNELTNSWELEAGASVLADGGELVVDEFDKLQKHVMLALNEPMEDRTITVTKANIQQTMSANINVLAGANPKNSKFDKMKDIGGQIDMPSSLLSRFDLIYALTDTINYENDLSEARQILSKNRPKPLDDGKFSIGFMRKYINYAKTNIFPELTDEAIEYLSGFYAKTRGLALVNDESKPITKRELGVIYRLTIAHARMILSDVADVGSAKVATAIYTDSINTLGLDYSTVGSIQNVLSEREQHIVDFIEDCIRSEEYYSAEEIMRESLDEYDYDSARFEKLYEIAERNVREGRK